jgi:hypothetical protein
VVVMYVQSAKIVSSNPAHGKVYSIQHYVIKKIKKLSDLRKDGHGQTFHITSITLHSACP